MDEADYAEGLEALKQFVEREGHAQIPNNHIENVDGVDRKLWGWISSRRAEYAKGKLSVERVATLEGLGLVLDVEAQRWQEMWGALEQFVEREGHAQPPVRHIEVFEGKSIGLGNRINKLRGNYSKGKLDPETISALENLPGWRWSLRKKS